MTTFFDTAGPAIGPRSFPSMGSPAVPNAISEELRSYGNVLATASVNIADLAAGLIRDIPDLLISADGIVLDKWHGGH